MQKWLSLILVTLYLKTMDKPCDHMHFLAQVDVTRLTKEEGGPVTGYSADIHIKCEQCGEKFVFLGLPGGMAPNYPTVSFDGTELRAPIKPEHEAVIKQLPQEGGQVMVEFVEAPAVERCKFFVPKINSTDGCCANCSMPETSHFKQ